MPIFSKSLRVLTALSTALSPMSGFAAEGDVYFFRQVNTGVIKDRNAPMQPTDPVDPEQGKDINAFFVGGVEVKFDQKLPMRSDWQDDSWSVVSGSLPAGISFDPVTLSFKGTPTAAVSGRMAGLKGIDREGREVASAVVTFDVIAVEGELLKPNLYAHTGKHKFDQLPVPAGKTIDSWTQLSRIPDGISVLGRNFEGTPTRSGTYPIALRGMDYRGNVVATYIGSYLVEDGPTFQAPNIADRIAKLPRTGGLSVGFGAPSDHRVGYGIDGLDKVRYSLEVAPGDILPGDVASNDNPANLRVGGTIGEPYKTASVRYKALDVDGTRGYSNWFRFGTSDPQPDCGVGGTKTELLWHTGVEVDTWVPAPQGSQGTLSYELVSGEFPAPVKLDPVSGSLKGRPLETSPVRDVVVRVNVTNGENVVSTQCIYSASVTTGSFSLVARTAAQNQHIRVGQPFDGSMEVVGGIPSYAVSFKDPAAYPLLSFSTQTTDTPLVGISGTVDTVGTIAVPLVVANGDGNTAEGYLTIKSHGPLELPAPADVLIKKYAAPQRWGTISYTADTIVPDIVNGTAQPSLVLNGPALPSGVTFDAVGGFSGSTSASAGTYGPYTVTLSDFTGETVQSAQFNVAVQERDEMTVESLVPPVFSAASGSTATVKPLTVAQPYGAASLDIDYVLSGPELPQGITFDEEGGTMTALGTVAFKAVGSHGPYIIAATDTEGFDVVSAPFSITVTDMPQPSVRSVPQTVINVTGSTADERPTFVTTPLLRPFINPNTVYGGLEGVTFVSADPASPAGLAFDASTGRFSGEPISEFDGTVQVLFNDAKGRAGEITVPLKVLPYPKVSISASSFDVPRLSLARNIAGSVVEGFRGSAIWSLDAGQLPTGITLNATTGALEGKTSVATGTDYAGIRLKAVDSVSALPAFTQPFAIHVKDATVLTLSYNLSGGTELTYKLSPNEATGGAPYAFASGPTPSYSVFLGGSAVDPVAYSLSKMPANLSGISIDAGTGRLVGNPTTLGSWTLPVTVVDGEGNSDDTEVAIRSTLDGFVTTSNGTNTVRTLRVGEPFRIPDDIDGLKTANKVGSVTFSTDPAILPETLTFDPITGAFTDASAFATATSGSISVNVKDAHERSFQMPLTYSFQVKDKLSLPMVPATVTAKQFTTAFSVDAPAPLNAIGRISYGLSGNLPGTVVTANYDPEGAFVDYSWEATPGNTVRSTTRDTFPLDALLFDTLLGTLEGTPSKTGAFPVSITAFDSHSADYIRPSADRIANNQASVALTLSVDSAEPLAISSSATGETLQRYTSRPTLMTTVTNGAYGLPVVWMSIAGTLPEGIAAVPAASTLSFSGYPQATGTYADIRYRARDAAGRTIESSSVVMSVENRKPLILAGPAETYLDVNAAATPITVTASNMANGVTIPASGWNVTGVTGLPDGMTFAKADGSVTIGGTPSKIGEFKGLSVTATDSKGGSASLPMKFVVLSPDDEINLQVSAVTTKANKPFSMTPTVSNTYGTKRFSSTEIQGVYAANMGLNAANGTITGSFSTVGERTINLVVSDGTKRLSSKPVLVTVLPNLRVVAPSVTQVVQYAPVNTAVDTDYKIGTVAYAKGNPQAWPDSLSVNPTTGAVTGAVNKSGTISGLFITATDTFGQNTDTQVSNTFSITATKSPMEPDVADITGMKLFTATTPITPITPSVSVKTAGGAWTYGGLTFKLNGTLPQGLVFDTATGVISGTPAEPSYTEQLSIEVSDEDGNKDTTTKFDIAVRDISTKLPVLPDYQSNSSRIGQAFTALPSQIVGKPSGHVTYSISSTNVPGLSINPTTGAITGPITATAVTTGTTNVLARDQSGYDIRWSLGNPRAAVLTTNIVTATVAYAGVGATTTVAANSLPVIANMTAPITYSINKALPAGMAFNTSNGAITGTTTANGSVGGFVVTATDSIGTAVSPAFAITANIVEVYRLKIDTWVQHPSSAHCVGWAELRLKSGSEDITSQSAVSPFADGAPYVKANLTDNNINTMWFAETNTGTKAVEFTPPGGKPLSQVVLVSRQDGATACVPTKTTVQKSQDGKATWQDVWVINNPTPANGATVTSNRP